MEIDSKESNGTDSMDNHLLSIDQSSGTDSKNNVEIDSKKKVELIQRTTTC